MDSGASRNEGTGAALTLTGQSRTILWGLVVRLWPATQPAPRGLTGGWARFIAPLHEKPTLVRGMPPYGPPAAAGGRGFPLSRE